MTPRHWLLLAFIAVLLVTGVLLVVAVSNRPADDAAPAGDVESGAASSANISTPSEEPSVDGRPTRSEVSRIESELVMPEGAQPLDAYSRFYAATREEGRRVIIAKFVLGDPKWFLEHSTILETVSSSVFIVDKNNLPIVMDGGCRNVNITYNAETGEMMPPYCNGLA